MIRSSSQGDSSGLNGSHKPQVSTGPEVILEAVGVTAGYGDLMAIRHIDLAVKPGEVVALVGPNGAGKSTTLLTLVGLLPVSEGEVRWLGSKNDLPLHRRARTGLAFVPEGRGIVSSLSASDNLKLGSGGVEPALQIFPELGGFLSRAGGLLSGGEQQMLTLGRALASSPRALVADELSLGLAPLVIERLIREIRRAADEKGLAVLLVEQNARRVLEVADRWHLMRHGSIVDTGDRSSGIGSIESDYLSGKKV